MQSRRLVHLAAPQSPKASPAPVFGALHEVAIERIRFDVAGDCDEMPVVLHDEGLEASLIDLSVPAVARQRAAAGCASA